MPAAVGLRLDWDAKRVRAAAREAKDADQARRLLAIAAAYEGQDRNTAAKLGAMDPQRLRDWVRRFNEAGPEGLIDRKPAGAARRLSAEQEAKLAALIEAGPEFERDGVVRWRCVDLRQLILTRCWCGRPPTASSVPD
jgi:transposase